jgi:hypothetical protein
MKKRDNFRIKLEKWFGLWCYTTPLSNNISVISWWSVLLVEEIGVTRENH